MEIAIKRPSNNFLLGILLVVISVMFYLTQFFLFKDIKNTVFYFLQDLAFVPVQVLIVSLVLNNILSKREKEEKLKKINIVISAFFTEIGTSLIKKLTEFNPNFDILKASMAVGGECTCEDFDRLLITAESFEFEVDSRKDSLESLHCYLCEKKSFILGMFENPNLLEHDTFPEI